MNRHNLRQALALLALSAPLALGACFDAPVERPQGKVAQQTPVRVEQSIKNQVDLLFMIDDSPSMTPKQDELKARFPQLIRILDQFAMQGSPANYHIGVVTSDLGSGAYPLCNNSKGAKLQARGAAAAAGCVAPANANYIQYDQITNTSNLPSGKADATELASVFTCMASVGANGCGFEAQLESVYKALHDDIPENRGFLRDNALLVVVWLTDEDDCSIPAGSDLFDPAKVADYGVLASYRCTRFSILYDDPNKGPSLMPYNDSGGAVANPRAATAAQGNKLTEVQKYIDFFKKPKSQGGVKIDPNDVILVGIMAPASPVSSIVANPQTVSAYQQCTPPSTGYTNMCAPVLQRACQANVFFGDPAVRIQTVISGSVPAERRQLTSICSDSYQMALEGLGSLIVSNIGPGCITSPFKDPTMPNCVVNDVISRSDGSGTDVQVIPECGTAGASLPCWQLNMDPKCTKQCVNAGDPGQQYGIKINRPSPDPLMNASHFVQVFCETLAIPPRDSGDPTNPLGCQ